jgi:hypothetical protein
MSSRPAIGITRISVMIGVRLCGLMASAYEGSPMRVQH